MNAFETKVMEEFESSLSANVRTVNDLVFLALLGDLSKEVVWADAKCGQRFGDEIDFEDMNDEYNLRAEEYLNRTIRTNNMLEKLGFSKEFYVTVDISPCTFEEDSGVYPVLKIRLFNKANKWEAIRHFRLGR